MGNFAENLNLGNRFRPPPPPWELSEETRRQLIESNSILAIASYADRCIQRRVIPSKQNSFEITSRGVQRGTSTDFWLE